MRSTKTRVEAAWQIARSMLQNWVPQGSPETASPEYLSMVGRMTVHPETVIHAFARRLDLVDDLIDGATDGLAVYQIHVHRTSDGLAHHAHGERGCVRVSISKVEELELTDAELVAALLHELVHALVGEYYGLSITRDDEPLVDSWMRANGYAEQADAVEVIRERLAHGHAGTSARGSQALPNQPPDAPP